MSEVLVSIQHISKTFEAGDHKVRALNDFSLDIYPGETVGLVGESGCGKTTAGRVILGLYTPDTGHVLINGKNVHTVKGTEKKALIRQAQMIFQDPYASLNPRSTVFDIIAEPLHIHGVYKKNPQQLHNKIYQLLDDVGLRKEHASRYPHEFSGGQRQRIGIARALALAPTFIVADEPLSALDVSIQAQMVLLLQKLQKEKGLTYLFIAHDLSMVNYISDRVGVMYLGNLVELASSDELYANPLHPYTQTLLSAIPIADPNKEDKRKHYPLKEAIANTSGCMFHTSCSQASDRCATDVPTLKDYANKHFVACHRFSEEKK